MKKKSPVTVSSGHDWLARYFFASFFVLLVGWGAVRSCYTRGMQAWRDTLAERYAAAKSVAWEGDTPPKPDRYVTDLTGVIDTGSAQELNERLAAFDRETSSQVVVYVAGAMPPGGSIEDVANRAYAAWQIGRSGKDNGVLFLVFIEDRQMRIEVGYGLEGVLTDALAKRIIEDVAKPFFKREAYTQGVEASARAIMDVVRGEGLKGAGRTAAEEASMFGVSLWSFGLNAIGFLIVVIGIAAGVFVCASIVVVLEKIVGTGPRFGSSGSSGSYGGGSGRSSSSSSSYSSSSSSSSSSFSGGGGRSGGGGASGSW